VAGGSFSRSPSSSERGSGVVRVAVAPRALDEAEHLRVEPIVLVQALRRLSGEEDRLWCGVDEREEDIARDFAEVHARDELLVRLEVGVYRLAVDLVIERRSAQHGAPVVERAPLGVYHHHAPRCRCGVVAEFGDVRNLLEVRAVRARSKYRAKDATTGRVRPRKRSAYRLSSRYATGECHFYDEGKEIRKWAYVVHESNTLDMQMFPVKRVLE
jgi:hypothetical protein